MPIVPMTSEVPSGPKSPVIALDHVRFAYPNGPEVLDDLCLEASPGITAIIGPSGCGKSTVLRMMAGLEWPTSGRVVRNHWPRERHPLSMVFQQDTLLPWETVEDNIALYYRFNRRLAGRGEIRRKVDSLLSIVGLDAARRLYPSQLSGGMRRRVAFLAAIVAEPTTLLLDEPFASVDEPTRISIHQDVLSIVQRLDVTTVLVTHDLAEAISLAHRIVVLSARPTRIVREVTTGWNPERDLLGLRTTDRYLELYRELWGALSEQIRRSTASEEAHWSGE